MKKLLFSTLLLLLSRSDALCQQAYFGGLYTLETVTYAGEKMQLFRFSRQENSLGKLKVAYFAHNAAAQFSQWKQDKQVLYYCTGAFTGSWKSGALPDGICVDNGQILNRNINSRMQGLVIVCDNGPYAGGIRVVHLGKEDVTLPDKRFNLNDYRDREAFISWAQTQRASVFQTQLMYSRHGPGFSPAYKHHGAVSSRKFLALCVKDNIAYHFVVEYYTANYLNAAAENLQHYLSSTGYTAITILNLEAGGKDVMCAYNDQGGIIAQTVIGLSEAENLLVYYLEP